MENCNIWYWLQKKFMWYCNRRGERLCNITIGREKVWYRQKKDFAICDITITSRWGTRQIWFCKREKDVCDINYGSQLFERPTVCFINVLKKFQRGWGNTTRVGNTKGFRLELRNVLLHLEFSKNKEAKWGLWKKMGF